MSRRGGDTATGGVHQFYRTPRWCGRRLTAHLPHLPAGRWLEPGAGLGDFILGITEARRDAIEWTAVEIREECKPTLERMSQIEHVVIGDFVRVIGPALLAAGEHFDVAVANPAFEIAAAYVPLMLALADYVVVLQRTMWLGDEEDRHEYFSRNMPNDYRLGRVDFDGRGGDATTYSLFEWTPENRNATVGTTRLLPRATREERREHAALVGAIAAPAAAQPLLLL